MFLHILSDGTIYADQGKRPDRKNQNNPVREPDHHSQKRHEKEKKDMPLIQMEDQENKEHDEIR